MVSFKKGCNWGSTEMKNWIATELKWKECTEESCKLSGSEVPLSAVTLESASPWKEWRFRDLKYLKRTRDGS